MITKDGKDVSIDALTADNYIVPKGEEMVYHCVIEVKQFDQKTGARISRPRIQKFGRKVFEQTVRDALLKQGYTIKVLYNPTEWIKAKKNQVAQGRVNAEARRNAEIDAAVKEAVAKALAEANAYAEAENTKPAKASNPKAQPNSPKKNTEE